MHRDTNGSPLGNRSPTLSSRTRLSRNCCNSIASPGRLRFLLDFRDSWGDGSRVASLDRAEALRIAVKEIQSRGLGSGAKEAFLQEEIGVTFPGIYSCPNLAECWIVYADAPILGLQSSSVVLISRTTGAVLYAGSAYDEG